MEEKNTIKRSIFNEKEELMEKSGTLERMVMPQSTASAMMEPPSKPSPMPI
jgi:hypothetical protein